MGRLIHDSLLRLRASRAHEVFAGEVAAAGFGFLLTLLAAARLGAENFGVFAIALAAATTATVLLDIRLEDVAARRFQALAGSPVQAADVWSSYFWADVAYAAVRLALISPAVPVVVWVYGDDVLVPVVLLAITLAISNADQAVIALLNVRLKRRAIALARAGLPLLRLLMFVVILPADADRLAIIYAISALIYSTALALAARPILQRPSSLTRLRAERRESGRLVAHLSVASSIRGLGNNLPQLLVGALLGNAAAGVFRLATSIATIPVLLASTVRFLAFPTIVAQTLHAATRELRHSLRILSFTSVGICLVALAAWAAAGQTVVGASLGRGYDAVFATALILLIAAACEYATPWSKILPVAFNQGRPATVEAIWYGFAPLIFAWPLIHQFGLEGAAWSVVLTSGIASVVWWRYLDRLLAGAVGHRASSEQRANESGKG